MWKALLLPSTPVIFTKISGLPGENQLSKILIVDDDKNMLEVIKYNLVKARYEVLQAENGIDAIEIAQYRSIPVA